MSEFSYSFWLPFPPSVNRIWRRARGRMILSADYVAWKQRADAAAIEQKITRAPVLGVYSIDVKLSDAFRRQSDVDNRLKAVADWCQRVKLVINDRMCTRAVIEWDSTIDHDCVVSLRGEVAFADQWAYARHQAEVARQRVNRAKRKAR